MKIADALLLQQDIANEISRLKSLAEQDGWQFRQMASARAVGEEYKPAFDLDKNHKRIVHLTKLKRKLSRAVSIANNTVDIVINDEDYQDWI